jgi:hypothetical protein
VLVYSLHLTVCVQGLRLVGEEAVVVLLHRREVVAGLHHLIYLRMQVEAGVRYCCCCYLLMDLDSLVSVAPAS